VHDWAFLVELGGVVLLLAIASRLAVRYGFSPIPLYLIAGLAFGEGGVVPLVTAEDFIEAGAQIGLVLLLFTLGLEYSAAELLGSLRTSAMSGLADGVLNFTPGFAAGLALGWGPTAALFLGGVTYISSSGVVARVLDELGWMGNREAPTILSILVIEDLVMAVYLPVVTILLAGGSPARVVGSVSLSFLAVGTILVVAARYGGAISRAVFSHSDEALLLAILAILLLVAGVAELLKVSAAVGAFLAGIVFSGAAADRMRALVRPLRDLFAAVFFIFFGFEIDASSIPGAALPALILAAVGVGSKLATGWWSARRAGVGSRGRWRAGTALVARGEFSIVIAGLAVAAGLEPDLGPIAATYVLVLAVTGPVLTRLVDRPRTATPPAPT
jgi:CPA2 family monovalent cation:H+ antiporter-2